jgi:hypothetical protein
VDWNNDGKKDLIAGDSEGNVWLFENTGTQEKPSLAKGKRVEADSKLISASNHELAEIYSKVHIADWDSDGLNDLLVGHNYTIILYKNVGTQSNPVFRAPTLIKIPERNFPVRPSPYVIDWDGDGKKDLLVGSEAAKIYFYRNVGIDINPQLARGEVLKLKGSGFDDGYRCRIEIIDWNNDGKKDILVGNVYNRKRGSNPPIGGNIWLFLGK